MVIRFHKYGYVISLLINHKIEKKKQRRHINGPNVLAMGFEPMRTYVQKILSLPP